jgi:hypothetical protein
VSPTLTPGKDTHVPQDSTTLGYELEPEVLAAVPADLHADLAEVLDEPDPLIRYQMLTAEQARMQAIYDARIAEIKHLRGLALRAIQQTSGCTQADLAAMVGLGSQQRVSQVLTAIRQEASQ